MVTSLPQFLQQLHHPRGFGDAEPGHRLVEQQQLRFGRERDREFEFALLAMAEFGHRYVGALLRARPGRAPPALLRAGCSLRALPQKWKECPSWACAASATLSAAVKSGSSEVIWNERASPSRLRRQAGNAGDVAAAEMDGAGIRHQLSGELADQRGLAGAVGADDGVQLSGRDIERQVIGRDDSAEPAHQVFDAEQGISHG